MESTSKPTKKELLEAILPHLKAERALLARGEETWDMPQLEKAREMMALLGMSWDFESWDHTADLISRGMLGGIAI